MEEARGVPRAVGGPGGPLRGKIEDVLAREAASPGPVDLGQQENLMIPLMHGALEFDAALSRAGEKAKQDFRREMGNVMYAMEEMMSRLEPLPHGSEVH